MGFCDFRVFFVVFGWLERGELLVICGELCGGFVVRKTRQLFEINLWKLPDREGERMLSGGALWAERTGERWEEGA